MYRIMIVAAKKDNNASLYRYLLNSDGNIYETETKEALDTKVEKMLNEDGYSKSDFIIVEELEYNVFADIAIQTNESTEDTSEETPVEDSSGETV